MAEVAASDSKLRKSCVVERRAFMLKDYLRDDFSSCSSNGFKSFPRRQCCTTVRCLLESDLKSRDTNNKKLLLKRSRSKAASTTISALQRASDAVLNAVKHLPFTSVNSQSPSVENRSRKGLLPRSFSRKLLRRSFWRKTGDRKEEREIERWKSFRDLLEEKHKPLDFTASTTTTTTTTATTTTATASTSSNSWSDSEFTSDYLQSWSGNSECSGENEGFEGKKHLPEKKVRKRVGAAVGEDSIETATTTSTWFIEQNAKKVWPNEEEKEQFSPVSVLDCPFDDEEEICSSFQPSLARMEGTKQKLMQKIRRFESLAQLEPVDLEKRIALSELDDNESLESPKHSCSKSFNHNTIDYEEKETEEKALELLELIKIRIPPDSFKYKADNLLLLDFFRDRVVGRGYANRNARRGGHEFEHRLLKVAEDWVNGHPHELLLDWQVEDSRKAFIRDMEEGGKWRKMDEETEEVALEVEVGVWSSLVNELVFDLFSC